MTKININDKAPEFMLPCDNGKTVSSSDLKGKNIVLYFYPKDDTPGCTQEAKDFRDLHDEFVKLDTEIIGVSKDSVDRHEDFKKKYDLPFNLLSDEDTILIKEYGLWVEKNMYGKKYMGTARATFLIDKTGKVRKTWPKVTVRGHALEVLEEVKKLAG